MRYGVLKDEFLGGLLNLAPAHRESKKRRYSSPNTRRFSFDVYCTFSEICNKEITIDLTTPQVCRYTTLWKQYKYSKFAPIAVTATAYHARTHWRESSRAKWADTKPRRLLFNMPNSKSVRIIFSPRSWFEETLTEEMTKEIRHARQINCSKESLNDVIFVCFTDEELCASATQKNSQNDRLYALADVAEQNASFAKERRSVSQCQW